MPVVNLLIKGRQMQTNIRLNASKRAITAPSLIYGFVIFTKHLKCVFTPYIYTVFVTRSNMVFIKLVFFLNYALVFIFVKKMNSGNMF